MSSAFRERSGNEERNELEASACKRVVLKRGEGWKMKRLEQVPYSQGRPHEVEMC